MAAFPQVCPKHFDMGVNGPDVSFIVKSPDPFQNLIPGKNDIPVFHHIEQKLVFLIGEDGLLSGYQDPASLQVPACFQSPTEEEAFLYKSAARTLASRTFAWKGLET